MQYPSLDAWVLRGAKDFALFGYRRGRHFRYQGTRAGKVHGDCLARAVRDENAGCNGWERGRDCEFRLHRHAILKQNYLVLDGRSPAIDVKTWLVENT